MAISQRLSFLWSSQYSNMFYFIYYKISWNANNTLHCCCRMLLQTYMYNFKIYKNMAMIHVCNRCANGNESDVFLLLLIEFRNILNLLP